MPEPTLVPHFSHLRRAPDSVLRGLRSIDPRAELVYLGWRQWQLIEVSPNNARYGMAVRIGETAKRLLNLWEKTPALRANPGAFRRLIGRLDFAMLAYDGARMVGGPYVVQGEPTAAIVDDYRQMTYWHLRNSDADVEALLDAPKARKREVAHADLTDEGRANHAWHYAMTRTHSFADDGRERQAHRSGFVRHPKPATQ